MRPSWDQYFMSITRVVGERSTCLRRQIGAIIILDKRILTTGYNGAPARLAHCLDTGCLREQQNIPSGERHELCRGLHSEQNAIIQAALSGVSIKGGTLYTTHFPCVLCAKMILNAGIVKVVYSSPYPDSLSQELLQEAGIEVVQC
ncbi:MAG: cytidine/deoxycytidylate deaminase family protein [bacterium]|nr:cytidine/deoxycytidylate deaminase family protein [bacterium]